MFQFNLAPARPLIDSLTDQAIASRFAAPLPALTRLHFSIRPIQETDLNAWCMYLQDERVKQLISWDVKGPRDLIGFLDYQTGQQRKWAIVNHKDEFVGSIGFHSIQLEHDHCEIAYDLAPEYWGHGLATDACLTMTQWAQQSLRFQRVSASALEDNFGSQRVLEKSGYNREGLMRSYRKVRGVYRNYYLFSHLACDVE